ARRQMQQYCDTLWSYTAQTIAENRNIPLDSVRSMASQLISTRPAESYIQSGLVDSLFYERMVNENLAVMSGLDADKDPRLISPSDYLSAKGENVSGRHIAVLYAFGDIVDEGNGGIVGTKMVEEIIDLAKDDDVAGMVLRVNSPGGSAFASEQIWDALQFFKKQGKPLYVSMGDYAASGGYYISCGADRIFADRTTITGSIGVFGMIPDASGLVTDKLGVTFSTVETNPNAAPISGMQALTPEQYEAMQQHVEVIYDLFTGRVAAGRGMSVEDVKKIAEGRVWVGSNALELGLVDSLGSLETTVAALADELDMSASDVISYPRYEEKLWEKILRENNAFDELKTAGYDMETLRYVQLVNKLRNAATVQARMEEITIQ
ncbi:MAG: signal peptide peptidase SppA, partial [Muribaculaceae bacterium]|nr:signal peptide peptidase SppA [Muribaculaceae bacterium]